MMYRLLTALLCLCLTIGIALGQTAGTADTNQAGLNVKVTETGNELPVQSVLSHHNTPYGFLPFPSR